MIERLMILSVVAGIPLLFIVLDGRPDSERAGRAGIGLLLAVVVVAIGLLVVVDGGLRAAGYSLWELAQ